MTTVHKADSRSSPLPRLPTDARVAKSGGSKSAQQSNHAAQQAEEQQPQQEQQEQQQQRQQQQQQQRQQQEKIAVTPPSRLQFKASAPGKTQCSPQGASKTLSKGSEAAKVAAPATARPSCRGPLQRRLLTRCPPRILAAPGQSVLKGYVPSVASGVVLSLDGSLAARSRPGTRSSFGGHSIRHNDMDSELLIQSGEQLAATLHRRIEDAWDAVGFLFLGHDHLHLGHTSGSSPRASPSPASAPSREGMERSSILPNLTDQECSLNLVESSLAFRRGLEVLQDAREQIAKEIEAEEEERRVVQAQLWDCSASLEGLAEHLVELREERTETEAQLQRMIREHSNIVEASRQLLDTTHHEKGKLFPVERP